MQSLSWLTAALISMVCFGLWGFFSKMTIYYVDAKSGLLYQVVGFAIIGLMLLSFMNFKPDNDMRGIGFGVLAGFASSIGSLLLLVAADKGKVTTVVTLTALYPLITILLAYLLLKEGINSKQACGVVFALAAIYLLT
jgi:transporter family protein